MKFSANTFDSSPFNEQVQQLTNIYEQWNDCERTVIIYALFKRLPFANLKFLVHSIDYYLKQSFQSPPRLTNFEDVANSISFLIKIVSKYNALAATSNASDKLDSLSDHEVLSDGKSFEDEIIGKYNSKDEILHDLLMYLPLLRPNNDEGKKLYMQFVPVLIEDTVKYNFPVEFVQQILSYLLIHPVIKSDDRKILHQWLKQLEEHISTSNHQISGVANNFNLLPSDNLSSFLSTTSSISSASSSSSASSTTWPTTVSQPPQIPLGMSLKTAKDQDIWDLKHFSNSHDFFDDLNPKYPTPIGKKKSTCASSSKNMSFFDSKDEHNVSFSKNGKEVLDFEKDFSELTKGVAKTPTSNSSNDFLAVPNMFNDHMFMDGFGSSWSNDDGNTIKTRRSNSLTTPTASSNFVTSSSAENLANLQNKPRSFSLTMESSRNPLVSSGSETRLDDFNKMNQFKYSIPNSHVGMGHIGVWLKSLRLHKYFWLFTNMSYDQMMEMTEDYLENLGVTKGARHKLVICIQKLAERVSQLQQIEKDLIDAARPIKSILEELTNIIVTPMKPINSVPNEEDVASHIMRVFDNVAYQFVLSIKYNPNIEDDTLNVFMWLLDKAMHHDAFQHQLAHLKEFKFRMNRIKMQFSNQHKMHFNNNNNSKGNTNKMRWQNNKQMKQPSNDQQPKIHRKNSIPFYNSGTTNKNLNFNQPNMMNYQNSTSGEKLNQLNQFPMMQQHHSQQQHQYAHSVQNHGGRNSLNNLMPFTNVQQIRRNSSCGSDRSMSSQSFNQSLVPNDKKNLSDSGLCASANSSSSMASDIMINSQLESLCRQMTESAIL